MACFRPGMVKCRLGSPNPAWKYLVVQMDPISTVTITQQLCFPSVALRSYRLPLEILNNYVFFFTECLTIYCHKTEQLCINSLCWSDEFISHWQHLPPCPGHPFLSKAFWKGTHDIKTSLWKGTHIMTALWKETHMMTSSWRGTNDVMTSLWKGTHDMTHAGCFSLLWTHSKHVSFTQCLKTPS